MNGVITLKTVLPLSVVVLMIGAVIFITTIKATADSNKLQVKELKILNSEMHSRLHEVEKILYRIEGKIDLILKK